MYIRVQPYSKKYKYAYAHVQLCTKEVDRVTPLPLLGCQGNQRQFIFYGLM